MTRGDGIANRLTHSPVNTPCPSYRAHDYDFLDDAIGVTNHHNHYSRIGRSRVICPVEIHVDASVETGGGSGAFDGSQKNLLDLESDDENILGNPYVFIGDGQSSDNTPEKLPYPDANSHSNYNLLTEDTQSFDSWSKNIRESYPVANSHRNTFHDSNSHSKYDVYSDNSDLKNLETPYDCSRSSRSIANSHETYRILTSDSSDKTPGDNDNYDLSRENLIPCEENSSYEIANSHSNYQIFYNSQTQYENHDMVEHDRNSKRDSKNFNTASPTRSDSSRSSRSTEETSTTCDIEECLVQIEESLLNIEQNLLHVQDLDIPELKNLLYKSPSIERSLFEVQDLLCTENLESVKRGHLFSFNFEEDGENLLDISSKDISPDSDHDTFTNDENLLQFNDEKTTENATTLVREVNSLFYESADKNVNFIPNSLGRTPTKGDFKGAGENIKAYSIDNADFSNDRVQLVKVCSSYAAAADVINDNLNSRIEEKKLLDRKKCHSRTNSLDENSIFQNTADPDVASQRKTSFESLRGADKKVSDNFLETNGKAKSDDTLDNKSSYGDEKRKSSRRSRRKSKENRLAEVEAKTEEFRRKIESIISSRQSIIPNLENPQKNIRQGSDVCSEARRNSQERSPRIRKSSMDKDHSPNTKQFKSNSFEKRKRKKTSRMQSAENAALVPSKLISLSLSLLLAALLQAVRCLTDLVEDAFRSVSYDRNGLLE